MVKVDYTKAMSNAFFSINRAEQGTRLAKHLRSLTPDQFEALKKQTQAKKDLDQFFIDEKIELNFVVTTENKYIAVAKFPTVEDQEPKQIQSKECDSQLAAQIEVFNMIQMAEEAIAQLDAEENAKEEVAQTEMAEALPAE
jgi:hypothetical protein